ncbi:MAG: hypothetical protein ACREJO_12045 [Phycisphaerales bacterium]
MIRCVTGLISLTALTGLARADFSFSPFPGPYTIGSTTGSIAVNDAGNIANVPAGLYSTANVTVSWGGSIAGAFSNQARASMNSGLQIAPTSGSAGNSNPTTLTWTGLSLGAGYNPTVNGTLTFNMRQSLFGTGANWTNIAITLVSYTQPPLPTGIDLGAIGPGPITIHTGGSGIDTEMGLYNSYGILIAEDDNGLNASPGESRLTGQNLPDGTYYIAVTRFTPDSQFGALGFAVTGAGADAASALSVTNGVDILSGNAPLLAGGVTWYAFTVPTPGAAALLGCGSLAALRRRRAYR